MSAMKENKIRALIREGDPTLNTRLGTVEPLFTEMIGASGNFDYVEFVAEYAPYSQADLENLCRAAEPGVCGAESRGGGIPGHSVLRPQDAGGGRGVRVCAEIRQPFRKRALRIPEPEIYRIPALYAADEAQRAAR